MTLENAKVGAAALAAMVWLGGCASTREAPVVLLGEVEADIKAAEEIGADDHAPLALRSARNHLSQAKSGIGERMDEKDYQSVTFLLERALADAEYATAKTHAEKSQKAAREVEANLEALRDAL